MACHESDTADRCCKDYGSYLHFQMPCSHMSPDSLRASRRFACTMAPYLMDPKTVYKCNRKKRSIQETDRLKQRSAERVAPHASLSQRACSRAQRSAPA